MLYVLIKFDWGSGMTMMAYQESNDGTVTRYCDSTGLTLEDFPPECSAEITDATPTKLDWMNA